ncbi:hypothetical protein [Clostridium beijerinckii]|uniref:hypothetical protein n=1 Tax=Clostridium beijerinckii TaxID=1520 RepID=UPI001494485F|nr:hypothetical protein [Clostridium beijerinckii]NOW07204.1 rubrerythrin [Clostridium beijerinckii]NYC05022.1 rubrerythrin [Clostridium beijerinckii]
MQMNQNEMIDLLNKFSQEIRDDTEKQLKDFFDRLMQLNEKNNRELMKMIKETIRENIEKSINNNMEEVIKMMKDRAEEYKTLYNRVDNVIDEIKDHESLSHLNSLKPKYCNNIYNELVEKIAKTSKENGMVEKENEILKENLKIKLSELVLSSEDLQDFYKLFLSKSEKNLKV